MKIIDKIISSYSNATPDGLEIPFENLPKVKEELKTYIKETILHMLKYCFNNVGNKDVNVKDELDKILND